MWSLWFIIAVGFMIGEIITPGFVLACFSIGCLASCLTAVFPTSFSIQLLVFSLVSLLSFFLVRPFAQRYLFCSATPHHTNMDALIGKQGLVTERINPQTHQGRVKVRGEDWKARSENNTPIETGAEVHVLRIDGVTLTVTPTTPGQA
ncbi:MAG: NfeD family protein [bacterium]|jgi:membrane protein implicated in regulation of membrane protease activity|nr:NfeD family protein [bacterium]